MTWAEEVAAAEARVRARLTNTERKVVADVPVIAQSAWGAVPQWGSYSYGRREVRIYEPAFTQMPDPENRTRQLFDVILHELEHALGRNHPDPEEHALTVDPWYGRGQIAVERGDLVIGIPPPLDDP